METYTGLNSFNLTAEDVPQGLIDANANIKWTFSDGRVIQGPLSKFRTIKTRFNYEGVNTVECELGGVTREIELNITEGGFGFHVDIPFVRWEPERQVEFINDQSKTWFHINRLDRFVYHTEHGCWMSFGDQWETLKGRAGRCLVIRYAKRNLDGSYNWYSSQLYDYKFNGVYMRGLDVVGIIPIDENSVSVYIRSEGELFDYHIIRFVMSIENDEIVISAQNYVENIQLLGLSACGCCSVTDKTTDRIYIMIHQYATSPDPRMIYIDKSNPLYAYEADPYTMFVNVPHPRIVLNNFIIQGGGQFYLNGNWQNGNIGSLDCRFMKTNSGVNTFISSPIDYIDPFSNDYIEVYDSAHNEFVTCEVIDNTGDVIKYTDPDNPGGILTGIVAIRKAYPGDLIAIHKLYRDEVPDNGAVFYFVTIGFSDDIGGEMKTIPISLYYDRSEHAIYLSTNSDLFFDFMDLRISDDIRFFNYHFLLMRMHKNSNDYLFYAANKAFILTKNT